jgi:hypothetical protein
MTKGTTTRRGALKTLTAGAVGAASLPLWARFTEAQTAEPIKIGFQMHRTGIGAAYGRWYGRTTEAAAAYINEMGGINGGGPCRSSPRMTKPTPSAARKWWRNSPISIIATWPSARFSRTW